MIACLPNALYCLRDSFIHSLTPHTLNICLPNSLTHSLTHPLSLYHPHTVTAQSGIDWLVVMPLFVVSQKYRKDTGTLFAPMPIKLVTGTFCQLGKQYLWQVRDHRGEQRGSREGGREGKREERMNEGMSE